MLKFFNDCIKDFESAITEPKGVFKKGFSRSAAYAYLEVQPLPSNMQSAQRKPSILAPIVFLSWVDLATALGLHTYDAMLASIAIRHTVDAVYVLNLPCYKGISCLASDASAHSLGIAALAYGGSFTDRRSPNLTLQRPEVRIPGRRNATSYLICSLRPSDLPKAA